MTGNDCYIAGMGKSIQVTARLPAPMVKEIEDYLASELEDGRDMTVAGFIRMAIRRQLRQPHPGQESDR